MRKGVHETAVIMTRREVARLLNELIDLAFSVFLIKDGDHYEMPYRVAVSEQLSDMAKRLQDRLVRG